MLLQIQQEAIEKLITPQLVEQLGIKKYVVFMTVVMVFVILYMAYDIIKRIMDRKSNLTPEFVIRQNKYNDEVKTYIRNLNNRCSVSAGFVKEQESTNDEIKSMLKIIGNKYSERLDFTHVRIVSDLMFDKSMYYIINIGRFIIQNNNLKENREIILKKIHDEVWNIYNQDVTTMESFKTPAGVKLSAFMKKEWPEIIIDVLKRTIFDTTNGREKILEDTITRSFDAFRNDFNLNTYNDLFRE